MIRNIFDKFSKTNTSKQFMINKIIVCIAEFIVQRSFFFKRTSTRPIRPLWDSNLNVVEEYLPRIAL